MKDTKIISRVCNTDVNEVDSVLICLTVDSKMLRQCCLAARMAIELEHEDNGCAPVEIAITVPAIVYEGWEMDEDLRDELWDETEGRVVDDFPKVDEEPKDLRVQLVVTHPLNYEGLVDDNCIWVRYFDDERPDYYSQPLAWLSRTISEMFLLKQFDGLNL